MKNEQFKIIASAIALVVASSSVAATILNDVPPVSSGLYATLDAGASWQRLASPSFYKDGMGQLDFANQSKSTFVGRIGMGYNLYPVYNLPLRVELAYQYAGKASSSNSITGGKPGYEAMVTNNLTINNTQSLMLTGYYDVRNASPVTPFIGLGIGVARVSAQQQLVGTTTVNNHNFQETPLSKNAYRLAMNASVGVNYQINPHWSANLAYVYSYIGKVDLNGESNKGATESSSVKLASNNVLLGVNYQF